jgi:hypothetical protein
MLSSTIGNKKTYPKFTGRFLDTAREEIVLKHVPLQMQRK